MQNTPERAKTRLNERTLLVCTNKRLACGERGGLNLAEQLEQMAAENPDKEVSVRRVVCLGKCDRGPNVLRYQGPVYHRVEEGKLHEIFDEAGS